MKGTPISLTLFYVNGTCKTFGHSDIIKSQEGEWTKKVENRTMKLWLADFWRIGEYIDKTVERSDATLHYINIDGRFTSA